MARVIARGVLSFGLVSIPVDIHSAIEDQGIHMHLLHKKCAVACEKSDDLPGVQSRSRTRRLGARL